MTYVRMTTYEGDPSKLEETIRFVREQGMTPVRQLTGYQGTRFMVDRQSGKVVGVTLWENEEAARAMGDNLTPARTQFQQLLGAAGQTNEIFELVINENA